MVTKIDIKKELKYLYAPSSKRVDLVTVPKLNFIMVDGKIRSGETPESCQEFGDAMTALYGLSYTLKFMSKFRKDDPVDYTVMAVEGLWWSASGQMEFTPTGPWNWTLMMMQPKQITAEMYDDALAQLKSKKDCPALNLVRFEPFEEGLSIQIMHVGPYSEEPRTIAKMKEFAKEHQLRYCGKHHEIYLGDPRRCNPQTLRTILRQPVQRTG